MAMFLNRKYKLSLAKKSSMSFGSTQFSVDELWLGLGFVKSWTSCGVNLDFFHCLCPVWVFAWPRLGISYGLALGLAHLGSRILFGLYLWLALLSVLNLVLVCWHSLGLGVDGFYVLVLALVQYWSWSRLSLALSIAVCLGQFLVLVLVLVLVQF